MITNSIGQAIRHYRLEKKLSQDELSKLAGVSYHTIVKLEQPNRSVNPTVETIVLIAKALGVSIQELIFHEMEAVS
jgi:transcriptional regulator with XRE-family HTH domain